MKNLIERVRRRRKFKVRVDTTMLKKLINHQSTITKMRNPRWHRNEIILALNLYFNPDRGSLTSSNSKIIELSEVLNKLRLPVERKDEEKFRNPNGVTMKLSNFLAIDPTYSGTGMTSFSKLDKEVFFEFMNNRSDLKKEAMKILRQVKR